MSRTLTLHIESIAAGGDGVARHEGMVAFVPRTAPGDVVTAATRPAGRLLRGRLLAVVEPGPDRVAPPCAHYVDDRCGGCQLQHLEYHAQLHAKAGIIRDSLRRIGALTLDAPEVAPSEEPWRYRRKLTLALRRRHGRWIAGLRRHDAPDDVFELRDCLITRESVVQCWREVMDRQHLLPPAAELRGAVVDQGDGFVLTLEGGQRWEQSRELFTQVPDMKELWWQPERGRMRRLHEREGTTGAGASFVQVNAGVAQALRERVLGLTRAARPRTVIDAYAGTGEVAGALAADGIRVTAIEMDRAAAALSARRLPAGSRSIAARVEDALAEALPADVLIVNPPRSGLDPRVPAVLNAAGARPAVIVYVSCDPATLARDLRRLEGYRLQSVRGYDMFPQTAHVETACELVLAA